MIKSTIKNRFIILGAGKNKAWDENPSLAAVDNTATFMNWQIETSHILHCHKVDYVGGYHLNEITQLLPANITVTHNPLWRETGALYSLLLLDFSPDENLYISYNDIALDDLFVKNLMHNDNLVCLADFSFPKRYGTNTYHCETIHNYQQQTGEFVGFLKIPQRLIPILNALKNNKDNYKQQFLSDLILHFMTTHIPIDFINAENHWCDINLPKERAQFILRGKARSLANLKKLTTQSYFLPQIYFSCEEWQKDPQKVHQRTKEKINSDLVIIRSSAAAEDN
jgi:choline kinase